MLRIQLTNLDGSARHYLLSRLSALSWRKTSFHSKHPYSSPARPRTHARTSPHARAGAGQSQKRAAQRKGVAEFFPIDTAQSVS